MERPTRKVREDTDAVWNKQVLKEKEEEMKEKEEEIHVMMMDSPDSTRNNGTSSASNLNAPSSESPQIQESPFFRFVNTLSPMKPVSACHVGQGFLGLNSPPLVFKSPRICYRETHFAERPQGTQSLSREISQSENGGNSLGEDPRDYNRSNSQQPLPERFMTGTGNDAYTQNCGSPPSVDEYLADPEDIDRMYAAAQDVEQSTDTAVSSLSDLSQSKENMLKFDRKDGPGDEAAPFPLSEESNKFHQEKPAYDEEPEKIEGEKSDVGWASEEHTEVESNLATDVFEKQYSHDSLPQCAENERWYYHNYIPQSMPGPLQDVKGCEDYNEMVSTSHVTAENISRDGSEAGLKYHGIRRRCLQFGEATSNALGSNKSHARPITSLLSQQVSGSGNFPVTGPKPSGIGLHLNSIMNAMPAGRAATTGMRLSDGLKGKKYTSSISLHKVKNMKTSIPQPNADGQSLVDTRNESHEIDASVATDSFIPESPGTTEPIPIYSASTHDKRKLSPTDAGKSKDFNQRSPSKKKKKTSSTADNNGCKRCNCKKSKCLKLYCECFALGIFCTDPCACQGCLNRPEYGGTVDETIQQIKSRNPLAFAPKIVQPSTDISSNNVEDINLTTPSSARHKRGCNCKRSMCLKKYCECYQAHVGCSSGCRCEGCKNVYGKKEDYVALDHSLSKERVSSSVENGSDSTINNKPEMVANTSDYDLRRLSPITPSVQCSDKGKGAAQSRLLSGNYLPSPEPGVNMLPSRAKYAKSSENLHSSHALVETNERLGTAPYDSQTDCNDMNMDQSSPSEPDSIMVQIAPYCSLESMSGVSSFSSGTIEWKNIPPSRLSHGCIRQLPSGSLRWRSSPVTPRTRVGEAQYSQCPESDSMLHDILENETPDILKEASTPIKAVKVNSPIQKRVSPPQSSHHGIGSSSPGGLRSSRRYVLRAVPSFPPLTPCVDSKGSSLSGTGSQETWWSEQSMQN